jgi:ribose transport system substrate-binding protein
MSPTTSRRRSSRALPAAAALGAVLSVCLAACSSGAAGSSSPAASSSGGSPATSSGFRQAESLAQTYSQASASIGITQPVGKPIPANKTIVLIGAGKSGEGTIITYQGFDQAAKVLGWTVKEIQPPEPTPQDLQQAMDEAIQLHPDAVAIAAISESAVAPQLKQLQAMHVPVLSTTGPDPTGGLLTLQLMGVDGLSQKASAVADQVLAGMGQPGEIAVVGIQGYSIIQDYSVGFTSEVSKLCPACTIKQTLVPLDSLGTTDGTDIVNFLRANSGVKAMFVAYDGMDTNLFSAARSTGITLPKTYSLALLPESIQNLADGNLAASSPLDFAELGWRLADAMARIFTGQTASALTVDARYERPVIWSEANKNVPAAPSGDSFPAVVPSYPQQYEKLWGKS